MLVMIAPCGLNDEERAVALVGLRDEHVAAAEVGPGTALVQLAADGERRDRRRTCCSATVSIDVVDVLPWVPATQTLR